LTTDSLADLSFHPPLPTKLIADASFLQEIRLTEAGKTVGRAIWHTPEGREGVVQLVELRVDPSQRRRGLGSQLIQAVSQQIAALHKLRRVPARRLWVCIEQKTQVIARAFLTRHGFHHVSTTENLLKDQDALVYIKAFD
jgi:ribosomal protein S18 acetylase RimI-like enzyme